MTRRRVIFPPSDYWTDPPQKENPPMTAARKSTPHEDEAALALVAVLDARLRGDQHAANVLLDPYRDDLAPVAQFSIELLVSLISQCCDDPKMFTGSLRLDLISGMAQKNQQ